MADAHDMQLRKIINKPETLEDARELLNLAKVKTGPGSGRNLGMNVAGLPAVCAYLASERLGNNDVTEKLAQQASCLAPKNFQAALTTVRSALADTLRRRNSTRRTTFDAICRDNFLINDDALYWMGEAEKELEKTGRLDELDVRHEAVRCAIYRFTCRLLGLSCTGASQLVADYSIRTSELSAVTKVLVDDCTKVQMNIEAFKKRNKGSVASTSKAAEDADGNSIAQRLKRKVSATSFSPEKKARTTPSPFKLNRVSVPGATQPTTAPSDNPITQRLQQKLAALSSPGKQSRPTSPFKLSRVATATTTADTRSPSKPQSPAKQPARDIMQTPTKKQTGAATNASPGLLNPPADETPAKVALERMKALNLTERRSPKAAAKKPSLIQKSPTKSLSPKKAMGVAGTSSSVPSSPTKKRTAKLKVPSPSPSPQRTVSIRHRRPPFLDRRFFTYRDPRVVSENRVCAEHFDELVRKFGFPDLRSK